MRAYLILKLEVRLDHRVRTEIGHSLPVLLYRQARTPASYIDIEKGRHDPNLNDSEWRHIGSRLCNDCELCSPLS